MNTLQILKDARALIADEKNWTQHAFARDGQGTMLEPDEDGVTCFCAVGALASIAKRPTYENLPGEDVLNDEAMKLGDVSLPEFNDTHTHAEVLALFDRAIARAESEAA